MKLRIAQPILLSLLLSHAIYGAKVLPVLNAPLDDLNALPNADSLSIDLSTIFGTEAVDDQVVRFTTQSSIGSLTLDFALFSNRTPGTRANFLNYVNDGDYDNSIIHRSVPNFVIQGGGFYDSDPSADYFLSSVPTDPPITNEFGISSTLGTISMAKTAAGPDSATSQWFVSLGDNSAILDGQNGGFTVFGRVTKSTLNNALSLGNPINFPRWGFQKPFDELPLSPTYDGTRNPYESEFLLFTTVELVNIEPSDAGTLTSLTYSIVANSDPDVVTASITDSTDLELDYTGSIAGSSTVTVRATDSVGNTVEDTFTVTVTLRTFENWKEENFSEAEQSDPNISGPEVDGNGDGLTNMEVYLHDLSSTGFLQSPVVFTNTKILDSHYASFTFPIRNDISDISYTIQQSSDLGITDDWSSISFSEISRTTDGPIDTVSIRADTPAANPKDFFRLEFIRTL